MSYTQMNAKYSTVENTVVTKGDILVQGNLPQLSNKYQILRGYVAFGSTGKTGVQAVVDELSGQPIRLQTGAYIDKVIAYSGNTSSTATKLDAAAASDYLNLGLATSATASPTAGNTQFMWGSPAAYTVNSLNQADPNAGTLAGANQATLTLLQAGMSCHPDVIVPDGSNYVTVNCSTYTFKGLLNVLIFVACP